jgi:hypothetical protein
MVGKNLVCVKVEEYEGQVSRFVLPASEATSEELELRASENKE